MKKITITQIMKLNPCYSENEIAEFFKNCGFKKSATPLEIAKSDHEKKEDLLWILLRPEIIPEKDLHLIACDFAELALKRERKAGREPHPDSWNAIKIKRLWVKGKATDEELSVAWSVAWSVVWSAARSASAAARSASAAAWSAARSAAWSAAMSAARSAARSAVEAVEAAEAAMSEQIKIVIKCLER